MPITSQNLTLSNMFMKRDETMTSEELTQSIMMNEVVCPGSHPPLRHVTRAVISPAGRPRKSRQASELDFTNSTSV